MSSSEPAATDLHQELTGLLKATREANEAQAGGDEAQFADWQKTAEQHRKTIRELLRRKLPAADPLTDLELIERALKDEDPAAVLRGALGLDDEQQQPRSAVPVPEVTGKRPDRLLSVAGKKGALLSVGGVLVLAGEGGIAKSPLALSIALAMAARPDSIHGDLHGGLFEGIGGPTLAVSYEDWPAVSADRLRKLASLWWPDTKTDTGTRALKRVHVLDLAGRPLFGPDETDARLTRFPGWDDLWGEVKRIGARLAVIDPALSAYVGDANSAAPVRDFMGVLAAQARELECGVVLVAHSRKAARGDPDPFDPGNVAGSSHWTDAARGVLTLTYEKGAAPGDRVMAVSKANYGPSYILCRVDPVRASSGEIVGFTNAPGSTWDTLKAPAAAEEGSRRQRAATKSSGTHKRIPGV